MKTRRRWASLLSVVLCLWLFALSSHVHAEDEQGGDRGSPAKCAFCLSLPSAAPAPALPQLAATQSLALPVEYSCIENAERQELAGYFSRGPPVA